jgi:hypothetical protein
LSFSLSFSWLDAERGRERETGVFPAEAAAERAVEEEAFFPALPFSLSFSFSFSFSLSVRETDEPLPLVVTERE